VVFESVDLSKREAVDVAFSEALKQVGESQIDIFVSNAGILPKPGALANYDEKTFRNGLELNMIGGFNAIQAMWPLLAPKAKVFNITSGIAHISAIPGVWAYAATKLANTKMFDYLQAENPDLHVVNIQPGVVETAMNIEHGMPSQDDSKCEPLIVFFHILSFTLYP